MQNLVEHQLRVTAVAEMICETLDVPVDKDLVVRVCLLHDMGNIIKSDLNYFPEFVKPEGLEYWQKVKDEFIEKHGNEEHFATEKICKELGFGEKEMRVLNAVGFTRAENTLNSDSTEGKVCCYADQRVGPFGVLPLKDRLDDLNKRYQNRANKKLPIGRGEELVKCLEDIEKEIFSKSSIAPESITDESIKKYIVDLKEIEM